jgi:Right handed beta helix region
MQRYQQQVKAQLSVLALAVLLSACGGGEADTSSPGAPLTGNSNNQAAVVPTVGSVPVSSSPAPTTINNANTGAQAAQFETINVMPSNGGEGITTSPVLTKADGSPVQKLEDLPEGISNSNWMKKTTGRLPLHVVLNNGTYYLKSPWIWTPAQSGTAEAPITVEAQSSGGVVVSGAKVISLPRALHGGAARNSVDFSGTGVGNFEQLWVNGGRSVRARAPNLGSFYFIKKQVNSWDGNTTLDGDPVNQAAFGADPASLTYLSGLSTAQKAAATVVVMHSWTTSHHRAVDWNGSSELRVTPASKWPFLHSAFGFAQRYFIENVPSALDAQGEWYLDPTNARLSYLPTDAQKAGDITFAAPRVKQLLQLKGKAKNGQWVEYLNFKGLKFQYAAAPLPAEGYDDGQAALEVDSAVQMEGSRNLSLSNCEISRTGGYAVWLGANVRNVTIQGCEMFDLGAGGVKVGLPKQASDVNATGYNTIKNNRIHAVGFQFPGAVGVWVGQSAYNNVVDNLIGDTTYTGISVGWTWGYGPSEAHHNIIARNFLYDIIQGSMSDGGGIYTLGVSPGTEVKGNVIKNVHAFVPYGAGAWGLYNDEGSTGILMDSNIVVNTDNGGYLMHYGRDITMSNNILAMGGHSELQVTKAEAVKQVSFNGNYIVPTVQNFVFYGATPSPIASYAGNLVSSQYIPTIASPAECGPGCSVAGNLNFKAGKTLEVPTLTQGSSPVALPHSTAGAWSADQLTKVDSPKNWWATSAASVPSRNFEFDATKEAFGTAPNGMVVMPPSRPELISIIRNPAGEKCLGFQDAANLANRWEPYSFVETNFEAGTTTVSFTIKADANTEFIHEWRDFKAKPYKVGPRFILSASRGVMIGDKKVADLPIGEWLTVTVTAKQGAGQSWTLQLKFADGAAIKVDGNAAYSANWGGSTKAVFFISDAVAASNTCLGKASIANQ